MDDAVTPQHARALAQLRAAWGRLDGHAVLVTGATRGIGLETATQLALLGADVLVHGRDPGRGTAAFAAVRDASVPSARPSLYLADLSTVAGVRDLAAAVRRDRPRLSVLIDNAGVFSPDRHVTADGLELTFAVNVVAPVLLAAGLLPSLRAAAPSRIVVVSSASHWTGELHWDDLQLAAPGAWDPIVAYDQSKLAVTMLTLDLAGRLRGSGVTAVCLDPGDVATGMLARGWPELPGIPVLDGAVTSVYLASSPAAEGLSGVYLEDGCTTEPPAAARDRRAQARLWREVERVCGPLRV